jgi:hypothetical protein
MGDNPNKNHWEGARVDRIILLRLAPLLVIAPLALPPVPASATTLVWVPAGTRVGLAFLTPVDSSKITAGSRVHLKVAADVVGGRSVIIRAGTPVVGTVTRVTQPGMFGTSSEVVIGFLSATAVDGRPIMLKDVIVSRATISNSRVGAAGASAAGAVVLGPIGLLAGAFVKGSDVSVPVGTLVIDTTVDGANVRAP